MAILREVPCSTDGECRANETRFADHLLSIGWAIGFTGSQHGCEAPGQLGALRAEFLKLLNAGFEWMHNGDCLGSDHRAAIIWRSLGGLIHLHPPTNKSKRAFIDADMVSEPRPYLERNRDIAGSASLLVATPQGMSEELRSGTWATVRYAREFGRPILIIWPDGTVSREGCPYCDDTGDVHRADGEWLGKCGCVPPPRHS